MPVEKNQELFDIKKTNAIAMSKASSKAAETKGNFINSIWSGNNNSNSDSSNSSGLSFAKNFIKEAPDSLSKAKSSTNTAKQGSTQAQSSVKTSNGFVAGMKSKFNSYMNKVSADSKKAKAALNQQKQIKTQINEEVANRDAQLNEGNTQEQTQTPNVQNKPAASNPFGATNNNNNQGSTLITANTPADQNNTPDNTTTAASDDSKVNESNAKLESLQQRQANLSKMQKKYANNIKTTTSTMKSTSKSTISKINQQAQVAKQGSNTADGVVKVGQTTTTVGQTGQTVGMCLSVPPQTKAVGLTTLKYSTMVAGAGSATTAGGQVAQKDYSGALQTANTGASSVASSTDRYDSKMTQDGNAANKTVTKTSIDAQKKKGA